jgi:hypothetical protein
MMKFVSLISLVLIGIWLSPIYVQETTDEPTQDVSSEEELSDTLQGTAEVIGEPEKSLQTTLDAVCIEEDSIPGVSITGEEIERMPVDDIEQTLENLVPGVVNTSP